MGGIVVQKSGGWGDRGEMAQIYIASTFRMMTAAFVAITYQQISWKLISKLWKHTMRSDSYSSTTSTIKLIE